ncbi:MAG TPA: hypothetical protein VM425_00730 [Myxococcota bacterium]|nr:hypothetical protein [Myxococcota bacterium]
MANLPLQEIPSASFYKRLQALSATVSFGLTLDGNSPVKRPRRAALLTA